MPVPTLSSSEPAVNATDVYVNKNITLVFASALDSASVTDNTIYLVDKISSERHTVSLTVDTTNTIVRMVLYNNLKENTVYRVICIGTDLSVSNVLKASDGTELDVSILIEFSTGDSVYQVDAVVEKQVNTLTQEGQLFLPINVKALGQDFTLEKIRPKNHSHGVAVNLTGDNTVRFTFSDQLQTGEDLSTWVALEVFPILDMNSYLAVSGSLYDGSSTFNIPSNVLSVTGNDLIVSFSGPLPNNVTVQIELSDAIESSLGDPFGETLTYRINTALYPNIHGIHNVRRELVASEPAFFDDYIGSLLFKNAIYLWEFVGRGFSLANPPFIVQKYVWNATSLDLIEDKDYEKFLIVGTRKQLGDLNVSVDSLIGRLALKITRLLEEKDKIIQSMFAGWQFKTAVKQAGAADSIRLNRAWDAPYGRYVNPFDRFYQPDLPAANVSQTRSAKLGDVWY